MSNMDIAFETVASEPEFAWEVAAAKTPPTGRVVVYRTARYQMVGYVDWFGRWMGSDGIAEDMAVQWWRDIEWQH
jgi:hypothetical protein